MMKLVKLFAESVRLPSSIMMYPSLNLSSV